MGGRRRSDLTQSPFFHFHPKTGIFLSKTQDFSFTIYTIPYILEICTKSIFFNFTGGGRVQRGEIIMMGYNLICDIRIE